jgi:hypothetical protein
VCIVNNLCEVQDTNLKYLILVDIQEFTSAGENIAHLLCLLDE